MYAYELFRQPVTATAVGLTEIMRVPSLNLFRVEKLYGTFVERGGILEKQETMSQCDLIVVGPGRYGLLTDQGVAQTCADSVV
jgi:hypothetical protein